MRSILGTIVFSLIFFLGSKCAHAGKLEIGQRVFLKLNATPSLDGSPIDPAEIPTPAIITKMVEDRLFVEKAWVSKGEVLTVDQAMIYFTEATKIAPSPDVFCKRAVVWIEKGLVDNALRDVNVAIKLAPSFSPAYLIRGKIQAAQSDLEAALSDFTEAIALDPVDARGYISRSFIYQARQELDKAIADLSVAISVDADNAACFNRRGSVNEARGELEAAFRDFEQAITLNSQDSLAFFSLGRVQAARKNFKESAAAWTQGIEIAPSNGDAYLQRANVYVELGEDHFEKALADLTKVLSLDEKNSQAYLTRARISRLSGSSSEAILGDLQKAVELNGENSDVHFEMGKQLGTAAETRQAAIASFDQAIRLRPNDAAAYAERGKLWQAEKELESAAQDLTQAILLEPENEEFLLARADIWGSLGNQEERIRDATKVIKLNPRNTDAWLIRGSTYCWRGNSDLSAARKDYTTVIEMEDIPDTVKAEALFLRGYSSYENDYNAFEDSYDLILRSLQDISQATLLDPKSERYRKTYIDWINFYAVAGYSIKGGYAAVQDSRVSNEAHARLLSGIYEFPAPAKKIIKSRIDEAETSLLAQIRKYSTERLTQDNNWDEEDGEKCENIVDWLTRYGVSLNPERWEFLQWRAQLLSSFCRKSYRRDGKKAVELATKACELTEWKNEACLETLAAAHAETGDRTQAVKYQQQAMGLEKNLKARQAMAGWVNHYQSGNKRRVDLGSTPADQRRVEEESHVPSLLEILTKIQGKYVYSKPTKYFEGVYFIVSSSGKTQEYDSSGLVGTGRIAAIKKNPHKFGDFELTHSATDITGNMTDYVFRWNFTTGILSHISSELRKVR